MSDSSPSNSELREASVAYRSTNDDVLELPDAPDFVSVPPRMTLVEYMAWCEEMLPPYPSQLDAERRAKARCHIEFVL